MHEARLSNNEPESTSYSSVLSSTSASYGSRRQFIQAGSILSTVVATTLTTPTGAAAATDSDPAVVQAAFDAVRQQVYDPTTGGSAYMQRCIEQQDFPALMEFTKTYDQVLRKGAMGKAKKFLTNAEDKEAATLYSNAVTFDLIGINRNSRPGKENAAEAARYLEELKQDVQKFLDLQPKL